MHDRLTSFCASCGLRQPATPSCVTCRGALTNLLDHERRVAALMAFRASYAAREARSLAREVPSVRAAPTGFATGASVVVVVALGIPFATLGPAALVAAGVASAAGGFAFGVDPILTGRRGEFPDKPAC